MILAQPFSQARLSRLERLADSYERVLEACASSIGDDSDYLAIFGPAIADIARRRDAIASRIRKAKGGDCE